MATAATKPADRYFLVSVALLLVLGLIFLISASAPIGYAKFHDTYWFVKRQVLNGVVPGIVFFLMLAKINYQRLLEASTWIYGAAIVALILVFIPGMGIVINGSRSWLGIAGFNLQPAELAKLAIIIFLAALLSQKEYDWENWQQSLLPVLAVLTPAVGLILLQPDVGTVSIIACIILAMLYIGGVPAKYLWGLIGLGVVALVILVAVAPYRAGRLTTFLHPELDPKNVGYQINQAFLAVGSGGFWGVGYGRSTQKFQYLPEVNADSIFAVVAEEMGFVISVFLILLILFIGWRILKIAKKSNDLGGTLIASGIATWIMVQSFLNIGAMVGALPLTGVPLPLVSHGGTAMLANLAALGIVASISKHK